MMKVTNVKGGNFQEAELSMDQMTSLPFPLLDFSNSLCDKEHLCLWMKIVISVVLKSLAQMALLQ